MHIDDDHRHYGSALIQIAENEHFTSINAFRYKGVVSRCGFKVNRDAGVHIRYRSEPQGQNIPVYTFTFSKDNIAELKYMKRRLKRVFLALVCVQDRQICCLPLCRFESLVDLRHRAKGEREDEYTIEVRIPAGCSIRVGINRPHVKGSWLRSFIIPRNAFPKVIFPHKAARSRAMARG